MCSQRSVLSGKQVYLFGLFEDVLRLPEVCIVCVWHVCEVRQMCEDTFRVSLSWLQIVVGYFKILYFLSCSACLSCLCPSLSFVGVCPVLVGFIFFPCFLPVCLSVSSLCVCFWFVMCSSLLFLAPILFYIVGASEHLHSTTH